MKKWSAMPLQTGNKMPVLGLGTWQLANDLAGTVAYALEHGYRLIDTSRDYSTQRGISEALKRSNVDRKDIYITTKAEEVDDAYERTKSNLEELDLDYIDLMLIHRPPSTGAGERLWEGLIKAKNEGFTRDIGISNYSTILIEKLIETSGEVPTVNQIEWSPFGHRDEMLMYCKNRNIVIQAYSPLTRTRRLADPQLNEIALRYNKSPAQILVRWNMQVGTVPIPKANQKNHIAENIDVFWFEITHDDMQLLRDLNENYSCFGSLPYV